MVRWLVAGLLLLTILGCEAEPTPASRIRTTSSNTSVKMAAMNNCTHFHNIMVDATDGVLTDSEFRYKIGEVRDGFMILRGENNPESQRVWRIVNRLYGAITPPYDVERAREEIDALYGVCSKYGY